MKIYMIKVMMISGNMIEILYYLSLLYDIIFIFK